MERLYRRIVRNPRLTLFIILLLTGFFAYHARQIRLDSSLESLLAADDPEKQYYDEIRGLFGSDEIGVIGILADDVYTPQVLQKVQRLTDAVEKVRGVEKVVSLSNAIDPIADVIEPPLLVPRLPSTPQASAELRKTLAERPIYLKNLVSPDGRAAAVNIFFADLDDDEFLRLGIDETIQAIVEEEKASGPGELYYTGLPHFKVYSVKAMWEDLTRFLPLALLFIVVVLFLNFRSVRGVMLPALTVLVSLTWTLGIMVLMGSRLSLGSVALPPLVLVLGTVYSLHVLAEYYEQTRPGRRTEGVLLETLKNNGLPVFITALTTVLGFLSLAVNRITSIREMGIYSAVGIAITFVLALVLVPALLSFFPLPAARTEEPFSPRLEAALRRLGERDLRHRTAIIIVCLLLSGFCARQIFSIRVDSNLQSFFRKDDPIRQATDAINQRLVGSMAFYVVIDGSEPDIIKKWDTLRRIKDLQTVIDSLPGVDKTVSFVDYCELLDRGIQELPPEGGEGEAEVQPPGERTTFWENPSQLSGVIQLASLGYESLSQVVNPSFSRTNILVRTTLSRSSDIAGLVEQIRAFAASRFPPELKVRPTGNLILLTRTTGDIVAGQVQSLAIAAGVIFVIMSAMFLSVRVGVIAMIPNLFPILVFFGLMGTTGAVLNLGTSIIASIALGIAVDNTVHLMTRLSSLVRTVSDPKEAILQTMSTVGKPSVYSSLLLFLGFLTLCLSTFLPIWEFGFLSAVTMVVALAADLVLLPGLLVTTQIITLWDLLCVKLGKDPHKTIGIFESLRPGQARIAVLMAELKSFPRGQAIIRQGEIGNEMFVMVRGNAEVRVASADPARVIRKLERGDVFGEMGLIRHHERTADVIAVEDVEVLAVNERFLVRLQRCYPRIAARIFLNIARILSDRLQEETELATR